MGKETSISWTDNLVHDMISIWVILQKAQLRHSQIRPVYH